MRTLVFGVILASLLFLNTLPASAISLDEFIGEGEAISSSFNVAQSSVTVNSSAVGGRRTLYAKKTSLGSGLTMIQTFPDPESDGDTDFSLGYTQGVHTGIGVITWDG